MITLVAAGDGIIGEHHVIKWPIARILIIQKDSTWSSEYSKVSKSITSATQNGPGFRQANKSSSSTKKDVKGEILVRYQHTPALGCSRSLLVFTQPRTRGMCSVLDFWPTQGLHNDNRDNMNSGHINSNSVSYDLSWFEPLWCLIKFQKSLIEKISCFCKDNSECVLILDTHLWKFMVYKGIISGVYNSTNIYFTVICTTGIYVLYKT